MIVPMPRGAAFEPTAAHAVGPPRRTNTTMVLVAAFSIVAVWTAATTLYIDWVAFSVLPWGDHWDHWRQDLAQPVFSLERLFSAHNEHRIAVPRLLYWTDQRFFAATNVFLVGIIALTQATHAVLLWRVAVPGSGRAESAAAAALAVTAAFASQQFTNFTWAFQVPFVLVFLLAHASLTALLLACGPVGSVRIWTAIALAGLLAWMASFTMSNGLLVWPLLLLLGAGLGVPRFGLGALAANAALAVAVYAQDRGTAGTLSEGLAVLPKALTYAAVVLGLPIDATASAVMQAFGLPTPRYPGLGGDAAAALAFRPAVAAAAGVSGAVWLVFWLKRVVVDRTGVTPQALVLLACASFVAGSALLIGLGRAPRFDVIAVMQSRYTTLGMLFWACLGLLYMRSSRHASLTDIERSSSEKPLAVVLVVSTLVVAINQPSTMAYARGYAGYLAETEAAIASGIHDPDLWRRVYPDDQAIQPVVEYFRQHHLSVFATSASTWPGQSVTTLFTVTSDCTGYVDTATPLASKAGLQLRGWAWDDREGAAPEHVVFTAADGRILGMGLTLDRRDDVVATLRGRVVSPWVGWRGVIPAAPAENVDAYLVRDSDATACRLGRTLAVPALP